MKRLLHTPLALLVWRIALLYAALMLCRAAFWVYNAALLGPPEWSELGQLVAGSLKFDTASVVYADGVFILLSLLPLHLRERRWYRGMLFWYYVIVNAVLIAAANLADTVYFRYTQKRFTADEIFFADNDNSLQLAGKFMAENWYLVLLWAGLVALLAWGYRRRTHEESVFSRGWAYYAGGTAVFALAAGLSVAGMRGGMTRMTRPITLSNAMLYTADSGKANLILSNPFCILRTIGSAGSVKYRKYFTPEELPRRFTPVHRPADSAAVDLTGRNVMIFIMESMSAEHSAFLHPELYADLPEKGFTPFLDSLMLNGLTFKRMYANGSRSIQAMPSVLGSIPSFRTPFVLMPQSLGESRQLPAMLADKGYATAFFCGSERGSMGFGAYARSAGVERLVSREDYEAKHGTRGFRRLLGHLGRRVPAIHGRGADGDARTLLRRAVHPLVAPPVRRTRKVRRDAARGLHPDSQRASPTTTGRSASSSSASAARSGSAARSSSSWPTTCRRRNSRRRRAPTRATCTSSASSTPPTAPCGRGRRDHAATGHHAHPAGAHGQPEALFRIRARRAERTAAAPLVGQLRRTVPRADRRRRNRARRFGHGCAGMPGHPGRRQSGTEFPGAGPAVLHPYREKELYGK